MPSTTTTKKSSIQYTSITLKRAEKALSCAPFKSNLFTKMCLNSIPLLTIVGIEGVNQGYTTNKLSERTVESHLIWLIKVGVLRREVDGQGITDSFRLTPLGRQILEKWQENGFLPQPSLWDRVYNNIYRWLGLIL